MKWKGKLFLYLFLIMVGYAGGIITGVAVDADQVYHTVVKKIKQRDSPGGNIGIEVVPGEQKSKKQVREERRAQRKENRQERRAERKAD